VATVFSVLLLVAPWLVEMVLICRLLIVFPPRQTPKLKLLGIFAFPATMKIIRLVCIALFFVRYIPESLKASNAIQALQSSNLKQIPYPTVERIAEILDSA
jgi:hypothetical protein